MKINFKSNQILHLKLGDIKVKSESSYFKDYQQFRGITT